MARNTKPIFSAKPRNSANDAIVFPATLIAAANDVTGVSASNALLFTASLLHGGYLEALQFEPLGTNVATMVRLFLNNGADPTVAANNQKLAEIALPLSTISTTVPMNGLVIPIRRQLQAGFRIYGGLTLAVAAGWEVTPWGGSYDDV